MDLHPLFVHFPIALLTLYSFLEVIRRFTKNEHWVKVRAVLVIAGTIGAFVSLSSGEIAEKLFGDRTLHNLLEAHAIAANATTWIYAILAVSYLILWLQQTTAHPPLLQRILGKARLGEPLASKILGTPVAPALAALGFIGLSLTGALGAILVYGPQFDPVTSLVYNLLFGR